MRANASLATRVLSGWTPKNDLSAGIFNGSGTTPNGIASEAATFPVASSVNVAVTR